MKCPPFSSPGTRPSFLGRFTVQERFRLFSHGHRVSFTLDSKDSFHSKHGGSICEGYTLHIHKNRAKTGGNSSRVYSRETKSSSSPAEECVDDDGGGADDYEEDYVDDGGVAVRDELACFRGLVLDISYRPINVVCWRRAICLEFMEKVDVLEYYDQTVNSPSGSFYIPAVMRVPNLLQVVKRRRIKHHLGRKNILYRDHFTCQYCSSRENLTIDHVLPISRGGEWKWENLVTACAKCNSRKGQKTLEEANMKLIKVPKPPKDYDILSIPLTSAAIKNLRMRKGLPDEWRQYLSKPSSES